MLVQPQPAATLGTLDLARRAIRPWNRAQTSDPNELDALQLTPEFEHAQVSVHRGTPELSGRRLRVRRRRQALLCGLGNRKRRKQPPFANGDIGRRLLEKGLITETTKITCFVLGSRIDPTEAGDETKNNYRMTIRAVTYPIFIKRAEKRLLELRDTRRDAPFLKEQRIDPKCNPKTYLRAQQPR